MRFISIYSLFKLGGSNFIENKKHMTEQQPIDNSTQEEEVKWDYTSSRQNFITGALVVGGNLLVILLYLLYRSVPAVHQLISGKPL